MPRVRPSRDNDLGTIVDWLRDPEIARWLDFGPGRTPDALAWKYGMTRGRERLFVFSAEDERPVGVIGFSQVHPRFRIAMLWYVLGDRRYGGRGLTTCAVAKVIAIGFRDLGLKAINAWTVADNVASRRILEKNGFRLIGRQRQCHYIDGEPRDRLLFDIVSSWSAGADPVYGRAVEEA